ncbi:MAG: TetR/AcrR family transcriptional regulator [Dehalococcoidia bacterium]|nr:TetR/AcrR family transcriptional regulator [Dehalococcoidia bacterium]
MRVNNVDKWLPGEIILRVAMARKGSGQTRQRILKAAAEVFYNVNYHEAGLRDIAKLAGVSPRCIYKYFPNKEQLLVAMNNDGLKRFMGQMSSQLAGISPAGERLGKMTHFYLEFFQGHYMAAWQVYVITNLSMWHRSEDAWQNLTRTEAILNEILADGQRSGEFRSDIDVNAVRLLFFGGVRFAIQSWLASERRWDLTSVAEGLNGTIYEAIKKRVEQPVAVNRPSAPEQCAKTSEQPV